MAGRKQPAVKKSEEYPNSPTGVVMSLRIDSTMHDRLRKISYERKQPMRDFIVQGIEMVLKAEKY